MFEFNELCQNHAYSNHVFTSPEGVRRAAPLQGEVGQEHVQGRLPGVRGNHLSNDNDNDNNNNNNNNDSNDNDDDNDNDNDNDNEDATWNYPGVSTRLALLV